MTRPAQRLGRAISLPPVAADGTPGGAEPVGPAEARPAPGWRATSPVAEPDPSSTAGAGQLAALVRSWRAAPPGTDPGDGTPPDPAAGESAAAPPNARGVGAAGAAREVAAVPSPGAPAAGAADLLGSGDELGRLLVSELRRYGIEVQP